MPLRTEGSKGEGYLSSLEHSSLADAPAVACPGGEGA